MSYAGGLELVRLRAQSAAVVGGPVTGVGFLSRAIVPLLAGAAIAGAHWVTLRSHRRVQLDGDGRITAGLGGMFDGVHVRDVVPLSRAILHVHQGEKECKAEAASSAPATFKGSDVAARALLEANPELAQLLEDDCSHDCLRYRGWLRGGRRGPKPQASPGDGRFDALNERLELRGRRRVGSWLEAVHVTVPSSRRWEDFSERLPVLEEATGLRLALPEPAEQLARQDEDLGACETRADQEIAGLMDGARRGRFEAPAPAELEEAVPF